MRITRNGDERGVTLVELVVTMALVTLVGTMTLSALLSNDRSLGQVDDETRGLADLRIVGERLSRDLRAARGVDPTSTASAVTIWIDYDADYRQSDTETITWKLVPGPGAGQYDVLRVDKAGGRQVVGHSLVSDIAFSYDPAPPQTRLVTVEMTYDAEPGRYAGLRTTGFDIRLRNVQ